MGAAAGRLSSGCGLWDTLWEAGAPLGLVAGGYKAIDSLRLEKGYRVWGADITPEDTPFEAGLGFAVRMEQNDFEGRGALMAAADPNRRLRCLVLDDARSIALGSEPVRVDGASVGRVTSGGFGYTVGASIAYAYLPAQADVGTRVEVEIFGDLDPRRRERGAVVRSGGREDPRVTDPLAAAVEARLARWRNDLGGPRRRDHQPQRQGHTPRRRGSCCVLPAGTRTCSGSTVPSSTRPPRRRRRSASARRWWMFVEPEG